MSKIEKVYKTAIGVEKTIGTFPKDENKWNLYIHKQMMKRQFPSVKSNRNPKPVTLL